MKRALVLLAALCLAVALPSFAQDYAPKPALEIQRSVSKEFVEPGGSVALFYRLENTGNVPLTGIGLTDPLCGMIASLDVLAPGEYRAFQVHVAVTQMCTSAPKAVWNFGEMRYERTLEGIRIAPAEDLLSVSISADSEKALPGGLVRLHVVLKNEGNSPLSGIALTDAVLGDLGFPGGSIEPGEEKQWQTGARVSEDTVFCVTARAKTGSGGIVRAVSNEAAVAIDRDTGKEELKISAMPAQEISEGTALFDIVLENGGLAAIANVAVMERETGEMRMLASVAPGRTQLRLECAPDGRDEMQFIAQFTGADGSRTTVLSEPIEMRGGKSAVHLTAQEGSVQLGGSAYAVFMYTGLALLALLAAAFVLKWAKKRRRKRLAREKRARRMRIMRQNARMHEDEWVQTREHKPVSLPIEKDDK